MAITDDEAKRELAIIQPIQEAGSCARSDYGAACNRIVRSKASLLAAAGVSLALAMPPMALAANDDTASLKAQLNALTQQLKALAAQNAAQSDQVKALSAQVQQLQAAQSATLPLTVTPKGKKPAYEDSDVVVTQQPGNVPGRSGLAPYAANGAPGYPYPAAPTTPGFGTVGTNPVGAGNSAVRLSLSGQIDRMEVYGNDGKSAEIRSVDNNISSSRFRFQGESFINQKTSAGAIFEMELRPNSSFNTTLTQDGSSSAGSFTAGTAGVGSTTGSAVNNTTGVPTVRWADIYIQNEDWGGLHLGFGGTAGYLTAEQDLSSTFYAGYSNVSDTDGGFSFRQNGAALIPAGAFPKPGTAGAGEPVASQVKPCSYMVNGKAVTSCIQTGANSFGPEVGSVFFYMNGKIRDDRVRYDSPVWNGFQLSTSAIDGGAYDIALRYGADWWGTTVVAAAAETFATSLNHTACAAYCYSSGTPSAGATLTGQANGLALQYGPGAAGSNQFDGSMSILHPSGLNLTVAGGIQDPIYKDPLGQNVTPTLIYAKLGWQTPTPWFYFGKTAFSVSYAENDELQFKNDVARDYAVGFGQNIASDAAQIYAGYHHQTLNRDFASYKPIDVVLIGGIARF